MKTKLILLGMLFSTMVSSAQTGRESVGLGAPVGPSESYVPPPSLEQQKISFFQGKTIRVVDGKIFNALKSTAWQSISGNVYQQEDGILFLERRDYSKSDAPYEYTAITNYFGEALADKWVSVIALRVGTYDMGGRPIEFYDCGTPYIPPPPTPEQIAAAREASKIAALRERQKVLEGQTNAVRWLLSQATNGDASAQCSLGEHYLAGLGCETNRDLAIQWLQKAADGGSMEASNKLLQLKSQ